MTTATPHRETTTMHPMFAELFMKPDEEPEADEEQRRLRRARRSRQLRTASAAHRTSGVSQAVLLGRRAS